MGPHIPLLPNSFYFQKVAMGAAASSRKTVLVVDDNVDLAQGLVMNLQFEGYTAACVHSGTTAIQTIIAGAPDAIILDVLLPDMGGLGVLEAARGLGYRGAVVMLSCLCTDWDKRAALKLGANKYITKPFDL